MKIAAPSPTAAHTSTPEAWVDVLAGLTGLRLAVLDCLLARGDLSAQQIAVDLLSGPRALAAGRVRQECQQPAEVARALDWLGEHRLALAGTEGRWRARALAIAEPIFLAKGKDLTHCRAPVPAPVPGVERAALRAVHASEFLDFGND